MPKPLQLAGQVAFYVAVMSGIGYFSVFPQYEQFPEGMAQIKLSFRHGAQRVEDCRKLTPEEIAKLPPGERRPNTCSRERIPIAVRIAVDGQTLYEAVLEPTGLSRDGPAEAYRKFAVSAGPHRIDAQLRDSKKAEGYDYSRSVEVTLAPAQSLAVDFKADQGGFLFR